MKKVFMPILVIFLTLTGCAVKQKSPADEFRGMSAEQIFNKGERALEQKKYETATKPLAALDALYPFSPYQQQAQLDLMYAYFKADDPVSAAMTAKRYIHLYPRTPNVDYAYYMRGMAHFSQDRGVLQRYVKVDLSKRDMGAAKESFTDFAELIRRYPNSRYAPDARERMIYLRNMLAQHELNTADFYYRREMYVAAQNRANYILHHYQGAPQTIPALGIMVETSKNLGLQQISDQSMHVLAYNYPDSEVYKKLVEKNGQVSVPFK